MYVIYINDRPLTLLSSASPRTSGPAHLNPDPETHLTANYSGKPHTLLNYADMLEKGGPKVMSVDILADDLEKLWADFRSKYKWVPAAGGVVTHRETGKCLFIYRRGYLDLPKGKIDKGETLSEAALREVREETGLRTVDIVSAQNDAAGADYLTTYHTYRTNKKGKRVLKPTYWFSMKTSQEALVPEKQEGIEWARWLNWEETIDGPLPFYPSLRQLESQLNF